MPEFTTPEASRPGSRRVHCVRLGQELPGLPARPFPGELGERLYAQVSLEAWGQWLAHSKMLVNEYRLNLSAPEARRFLMEQCEKFFFGGGSAAPPDFTPPAPS
jgi:Fe-S cluster biosynthesis and repair protein YggX